MSEPGAAARWSLEEWRRHVLGRIAPLEPIDLALLDAHGSVVVDDLTAVRPVPAHPVATTAGFALRAEDADVDATLGVAGVARAGEVIRVHPGQAVRVAAGAALPDDADAVLPTDQADDRGEHLVVVTEVAPGDFVRPAGAELAEDAALVAAGTPLGAEDVGLLAAAGHARVRVHPQPRVAVLSAGDDIVDPAARPLRGQVPDVSGVMLTAMAREAGARGVRHRPVPGDADVLRDALEGTFVQADLVVTAGPATVDEPPDVDAALSALGDVERAHVGLRPGATQVFGIVEPEADRAVPVFGLPGEPVAAAVGFEVLVRPAIRRLQGRRDLNRPRIVARLAAALPGRADEVGFARVGLRRDDDAWVATPLAAADDAVLSTLTGAHGLAEVPAGTAGLDAGQSVLVHLLVDPG